MTDLRKLRKLAEKVIESKPTGTGSEWRIHYDYEKATSPETVIALIDKVEATESLNSSLYSEIRRLRSQLAEYENDDDEIVGCSNGCGEVVRLGGFCSTACKLEWEVEHDEFDE